MCIRDRPLAEQQRIVTEIERWFTLIDQIEQDKSDLQTVIKLSLIHILYQSRYQGRYDPDTDGRQAGSRVRLLASVAL